MIARRLVPLALVLAASAVAPAAARGAAEAPAAREVPEGPLGDAIRLGKELFERTGTHPLTRRYVKNALSCASCHPQAGAQAGGATLVGVAAAYPAWSPREKAVITLEDRVLNCFMRSMNGLRPPNGSAPAVAITAYLTWLSTGERIAQNPEAPLGPRSFPKLPVDPAKVDTARGAALYAERCAACHGEDGQGDPPVWGPRSYNAGAGLADATKLAGFLKVTMPPDEPNLQDGEAVDLAAFLNAKPRPDFDLSRHLSPGGAYNATVRGEVVRAPTWPPRRAGKR
ncbi:c-type cytochrome [Anaeromyxobacter terrae]|uniref:c-type cytochrome n=1 Tax=Anaeromyxobacter terrae TaxID=2925406 RepID=UPI001F55B8D8|nr:c-type cytochrome [Anaeromyxobacter sp. SG22]